MAVKGQGDGVASRLCAARVLAAVYMGRSLSDLRNLDCVQETDQPFVQAICYGVLRDYPRHQRLLASLLDRPLKMADIELEALLHSALYQIDRMRVPAHAAVNASVEASRGMGRKWAAGLVNAVLRRYIRDKSTLDALVERDEEARYAMPAWLLGKIRKVWPGEWPGIVDSFASQPPFVLRVNRQRMERSHYGELLDAEGIAYSFHPLAADALTLERPVGVDRLPGFADGLVSVQDAGAQLAGALLNPQVGERILDACAAPGGKSCHLLELAGGDISLTAMDVDAVRLARVEENLTRLGLSAELVSGDATQAEGPWAQRRYNKILLDAPCSATGVIRRHPDIKVLRRPEDLKGLADTQYASLCALWSLLEPGGLLLYATCSILPQENEQQLQRFLRERSDAHEESIDASWGVKCAVGRQILPGEYGMDGFYYALLRKGTA